MSDKAIQGTHARRFTIRDLPMLGAAVTQKRWPGINDEVKKEVTDLIKATVSNQDAPEKERLRAAALAVKIDSLNMKDEQFRTPRMDADFSLLSDEDLDAQIAMLEQVETSEDIKKSLMESTPEERLEQVEPMTDCLPHPELLPLGKFKTYDIHRNTGANANRQRKRVD